MRPWERIQQARVTPASAAPPTPAPTDAAIVTPAAGPSQQEPPKPIVVQNALVGAGTTALTNTLTAGMTDSPEILWCSMLLNVVAQGIKQWTWFNERLWLIWFVLGMGIFAMCWYFRDPMHWDLTSLFPWGGHFLAPGYLDIPSAGVLKGGTAAAQSLSNYRTLAATGVSPFSPTPYERSVEGQAALRVAPSGV